MTLILKVAAGAFFANVSFFALLMAFLWLEMKFEKPEELEEDDFGRPL